jgi:hypothetical protein
MDPREAGPGNCSDSWPGTARRPTLLDGLSLTPRPRATRSIAPATGDIGLILHNTQHTRANNHGRRRTIQRVRDGARRRECAIDGRRWTLADSRRGHTHCLLISWSARSYSLTGQRRAGQLAPLESPHPLSEVNMVSAALRDDTYEKALKSLVASIERESPIALGTGLTCVPCPKPQPAHQSEGGHAWPVRSAACRSQFTGSVR